MRRWWMTAAATAAAAAIVLVAELHGGIVPTPHRDAPLRAALEASASLVALLTAYLVVGRVREGGRVGDLFLACALSLSALANCGAVVRVVEPQHATAQLATWWSFGLTATSTACYAVAALLRRRGDRRRLAPALTVVVGVVALVLVAVPVADALFGLPEAVSAHTVGGVVHLSASPLLLGGQAAFAVLFGIAAIGFTLRSAHDDMLRWLGAGTAVAAVARLDYVLSPSVYSPWVSSADFLRVCFHLLILTGAAREIRGYWRRLSHLAVLEERRRLARDLHDGLAQELAFIASEASGAVAAAAERALDESRRAIAALTRPIDEPIELALGQAAEEVAGRVGTTLELAVDSAEPVAPAVREALIRIVREAVTNAARHGRAAHVRVSLRERLLQVVDDGDGCELRRALAAPGFGLISMRERAEVVGAGFSFTSAPGRGATVEVRLP
jgi:signal transduction histidine kinase